MPADESAPPPATSAAPAGAAPSFARYLRRLTSLPMLPLLALALVLAADNVRRLHEADDRAATALAAHVASRADDLLHHRMGALQLLADSPLLDTADLSAFHRRVQGFRAHFGSDVVLADDQGHMLLHGGVPLGRPLPPLPRPSGHAAAPAALATGRPAVGDLFIGPVNQRSMVAVAVPIVRAGHAPRVLLTAIPADSFERLVAAPSAPADWRVSLRDGRSQVIAGHPGPAASAATGGARFLASAEAAHWTADVELTPAARLRPVLYSSLMLLAAIGGATLAGMLIGSHGGRRLASAVASIARRRKPGPDVPEIAEIDQARATLHDADTARAAAGEALQRSEAALRAAFEGLPDALVMVDAQRRITMINPAFTRLFGYGADEAVGRTTEFLYADPADFGETGRTRYRPEGAISQDSYELRYRRRDGSTFWAESVGMRIVTAGGESLGMLGMHRDVTQRRQAHEALQRSRAQLEAFVQQAPHSIALLDREMNYIAVSQQWQQHYGSGQASLVGLNHYSLLPDLPAAWKTIHQRALAGETQRNDSDRWVRADGREQWLRWVVQPWTDSAGGIGGLIISTDDITEQQRTLADAREAHERFATLFDTAPVAMVVGDLQDGRFVEVNAAFEALTGHARDAVRHRSSDAFTLWPEPGFREQMHAQLKHQGRVPPTEATLQRRSGERIAVSFSACTVEIAGRAHFIAMMLDVTAQREARQVLQRQQAELEALVAQRTVELEVANATLAERAGAIADLYDNAPCGYHSLDRDGIIIAANETELAMLGYPRDEYVGQPIARFFTPHSQALFQQRFVEFQRTGAARDLEYDIVRKDGSVLPVLLSAVMIRDAQGRHVANRATLSDNSERKARQQQIERMQSELARRAEEAEAATRAKSAFLANMSHEIRTPMNAISGLTHLMARDTRDPLQSSRLAKIDGAARHLLQVINDILDLSKIEAGKMSLEEVEFSLDDLLSRIFEIVGGRAREKGLELVLDTDSVPATLRGDPTRLSQAVINLLSNAIKFTDAGWVRLRIEVVGSGAASGLSAQALQLRFEVSDTGIGIAAEDQAHLFGAFEQADNSISRRHGGTGLGLALTRRIAAMMGGEAGVDSALHQGSRFWFTAWLQADRPPSPLHREFAGRRALLVDDLAEARAALRARLVRLGLAVDDPVDPQQAIAQAVAARAAGHPYDVLVIDSQLGPLDGPELLGRFRGQLGSDTPPALLVATGDDEALQGRARAAGFAHVLLKPVTPSTLNDALGGLLLGAHRPWQPAAVAPMAGSMELRVRAAHRGRRVLLAEDNPINQEVAAELLRAVGLEVEIVGDGRQAAERALAGGFDLVLMDMQMPVVDGLAATRRIRAAGLGALPIVAMTANAFGEDRQACLDAGMNDHVGKPVAPEVLYAALARWLPAAAPDDAPGAVAPAAPAARPSQPLQDRLADVDGIDVGRLLHLMGGQPAVMRRVLASFVKAYGGALPVLDATTAHSLRGACASIGAVQLEAGLLAYERAAADGCRPADLQAAAADLLDDMRRLVERLERELAA